MIDPPYRIETERLVVRCWEPRDAPLLKDAVDSSREHLSAWMPWAEGDPLSLDEQVDLVRRFRGQFDLGQDFVCGIFDRDETEVLGGSGFHTRVGEDALEIGYWIRASQLGQGFATESTAAITKVGFEVCGVDRIEIRVDPGNERSIAIPVRLGYTQEATLRRRLPGRAGGELRDVVVFSLFRDAYPGTPSADADLRAFDALGRRVL